MILDRLLAWLRPGRRRATVLPPQPDGAPVSERSAVEAVQRMQIALRRSRLETAALRSDGSQLADRVRRNAVAGRNALEGKS